MVDAVVVLEGEVPAIGQMIFAFVACLKKVILNISYARLVERRSSSCSDFGLVANSILGRSATIVVPFRLRGGKEEKRNVLNRFVSHLLIIFIL